MSSLSSMVCWVTSETKMKLLVPILGALVVLGASAQGNLIRQVDVDSLGRVVEIRDLRAGKLVWQVTYEASGLPVTETSFDNGALEQRATLEFRNRTLSRRFVVDAKGILVYTDTLSHWPDGSLRRLERDGPQGPLAQVAWAYGPSGDLEFLWSADEEALARGEHREWSSRGATTEEALVAGTQRLLTRVTEALEAGRSQETRTDLLADRVETRWLDARGRVTEEKVTVKGVVTQTRAWSYDSLDKILSLVVEEGGKRQNWTYVYANDGTVLGSLRDNGVLVREELVLDGEKLSVSLYDKGDLFLVETWANGKKVKEVYYQRGVVIRERLL